MYLADCIAKLCEWDYLCDKFTTETENEQFGRVLEGLHVLVKHPEQYQKDTGKDPAQQEYVYRELLKTVRHVL